MLLLKYDLQALYEKDLETMTAKGKELMELGANSLEKQACSEIISSLNDSLANGIGNNQAYTCKGVYKQVGEHTSQKIDSPTEFYLLGYSQSKRVLERGQEKPDTRRRLTVEKDKFRKDLLTSKIRRFKLDEEFFNEFRSNKSILTFTD